MENKNKFMFVAALLLASPFIVTAAEDDAPNPAVKPSLKDKATALLNRIPGSSKVVTGFKSVKQFSENLSNPENYGPRDARSFTQIATDNALIAKDKAVAVKDVFVGAPKQALNGLKATFSVLLTNWDVSVSAPFVVKQLWNQIPDAYKAMAFAHLPTTVPGAEKLFSALKYAENFKAAQFAGKGLTKGQEWALWLAKNSWVQRIEQAIDQKVFNKIPLLCRVEGPYRKALSVLSAYVILTKVVLPYVVRSNKVGLSIEGAINTVISSLVSYIPILGRAVPAAKPADKPADEPAKPAAKPADKPAANPVPAPQPAANPVPAPQPAANNNNNNGSFFRQAASTLTHGIIKTQKRLNAEALQELVLLPNEDLKTKATAGDKMAQAIVNLKITGQFNTYFTGETINNSGVTTLAQNVTGYTRAFAQAIALRALLLKSSFKITQNDGIWTAVQNAIEKELSSIK